MGGCYTITSEIWQTMSADGNSQPLLSFMTMIINEERHDADERHAFAYTFVNFEREDLSAAPLLNASIISFSLLPQG